MDNKFVPNYQFPIEEINKLIPLSTKKIDIHLMVEDPLTYINKINTISSFYSSSLLFPPSSHCSDISLNSLYSDLYTPLPPISKCLINQK